MSIEIQKDFDRLQIQKESEMKTILISFAKIHMHYCEQVRSFIIHSISSFNSCFC